MQVTSKKDTPLRVEFLPVEVTFRFEKQAELDAMGKLFNYTPFASGLRNMVGTKIQFWENFKSVGAKITNMSNDGKTKWEDAINQMCTKTHTIGG